MMPRTNLRERLVALRRTLRPPLRTPARVRDLASERLVYETLAQDPSGVFTLMDWETRVRYYQAAERHARCSGLTTPAVAHRALAAAQAAARDSVTHPALTHVGYYLVGPGARAIQRPLRRGPRETTRPPRLPVLWPQVGYRGVILLGILIQAAVVGSVAGASDKVGTVLLASLLLVGLPIFHIHAVNVAQTWLRSLFPLRLLPKLAFEKGIPDAARTLLVVPTVVASSEQARNQVARLADLAELNPDPNIRFALLSDFCDCSRQTDDGDEEILRTLAQVTNALNGQYRDRMGDRFFVLHRDRSWNPVEGAWIGWERKRGKLQELNRALRGTPLHQHFRWVFGDLETFLADHPVKYVLTLDDTTWLEKGEATQLIRTAAHPLNRAVLDPTTGRITEGYGILQPTIVPALSSTPSRRNAIRFGDLTVPPRSMRGLRNGFSFDAFGEGAFAGKALYDVDAFRACLEDVLPLNAVLSHDRLEGWHVRTAEVCDSFIIEAIPGRYLTAFRQRHRWSRGDTQLALWLLPRVRDAHDRPRPNPLPVSGRLAVADLLLRTIFGPARLAFLVLCWTFVPNRPYLWPTMAFATLLYPIVRTGLSLVVHSVHRLRAWDPDSNGSGRRYRAQLANLLVAFVLCVSFLAVESLIVAGAVMSSLWRIIVSHKNLLQWTPQHEVERTARGAVRDYWRLGWPSTLVGLGIIAAVPLINPTQMAIALPVATLWTVAFVMCWFLDQPPGVVR